MTDAHVPTPEDAARAEKHLIALDRLHTFLREADYGLSRVTSDLIRHATWPPESTGDLTEGMGRWSQAMTALRAAQQTVSEYQHQMWQYYEGELDRLRAELDIDFWRPTWHPGWQVDEAVSLFARADEDEAEELEQPLTPIEDRLRRYIEAGQALEREFRRVTIELERERARNASLPSSGPRGSALTDGEDEGGRRHFLQGRGVHAGEGLRLLTRWGWVPVRFETTGDQDPIIYLSPIPGDEGQFSLRVDERMIFAWPDDFEKR